MTRKRLYSAVMGTGCLLLANTLFAFDRQDSLRGGQGSGRTWWDVQHYDLWLRIDQEQRHIEGRNRLSFKLTRPVGDSMQIDLQAPMQLSAVHDVQSGRSLLFSREGNVYWLHTGTTGWGAGSLQQLELTFSGQPRPARNPPWDGGMIWTRDSLGQSWTAVACQGLGASSWWPCKDDQSDEPDQGMKLQICRSQQELVSNGRHKSEAARIISADSLRCDSWEVVNPVNAYDISFYMGDYMSWNDTFQGLKGTLDLGFYALKYHETVARRQFVQVKQMLRAFEYWFGPYPFYEDGYKIVEAPFLGMEHQSAIAYGNEYKQGYRGNDRSGTGVGLLFDFIIVHESGHEWFGNSITAADIADNWIHEGFTTYSETLFAEYWFGREKAWAYTRGEWKNIRNDRPVIGSYGVHQSGSGDQYDKGSALIHAIRLCMNDDTRFRAMLHTLCRTFYHRQVTTAEVEALISRVGGQDFTPLFEQYLRTVRIPVLEYEQRGRLLRYRFKDIVPGFSVPVALEAGGRHFRLMPSGQWQQLRLPQPDAVLNILPGALIRVVAL